MHELKPCPFCGCKAKMSIWNDKKTDDTWYGVRCSNTRCIGFYERQMEMIIVFQVNAPLHMAQGIKETLAMQLEKFGDTKVLEIRAAEETATQEVLKQWKNG